MLKISSTLKNKLFASSHKNFALLGENSVAVTVQPKQLNFVVVNSIFSAESFKPHFVRQWKNIPTAGII